MDRFHSIWSFGRKTSKRIFVVWEEIHEKTADIKSDAFNKVKSKLACILEASESTRLRMGESLPTHQEDHIAAKRRQFTTAL